jgi:hypothetical protein
MVMTEAGREAAERTERARETLCWRWTILGGIVNGKKEAGKRYKKDGAR